jgi:DNA repair exonuclease SbcCD ATPase subunit
MHSSVQRYVSECERCGTSSRPVQDEASAEHGQELQSLRINSTATMEQIRTANQATLEDLKSEHASTLEAESNRLEKQINALKLDLKATQDDLAKAKAGLETARSEVQDLTAQRDEARAAAASIPQMAPEDAEEMARLSKELSNTKDDLAAVTDMLELTKASLTEMSHNKTNELEEAAKARADEVTKLRSAHEEEVASLVAQKSELMVKLSDLEGDLTTLRATISSEAAAPKGNSNGVAHASSPGVTKEELQRMYEAHNLKMHDLQAEHDKAVRALKIELEGSERKTAEVQEDLDRRTMEIQYLEQEQEESQEQITRYVGFFRWKSFIAAAMTLAVIYGFI